MADWNKYEQLAAELWKISPRCGLVLSLDTGI